MKACDSVSLYMCVRDSVVYSFNRLSSLHPDFHQRPSLMGFRVMDLPPASDPELGEECICNHMVLRWCRVDMLM